MLTEKEKLQRAKLYMQKLSEGIDPVSNAEIPQDNPYQTERLKKCFAYLVTVLEEKLNSKETAPKTERKRASRNPFFIQPEQIAQIEYSEEPCAISELVAKVNAAAVENDCKKLQPKHMNDWLVEQGYLQNQETKRGKHREVTDKAQEIGIITRQGMGAYGAYTIILYPEQAQRFLVEHIQDIVQSIE